MNRIFITTLTAIGLLASNPVSVAAPEKPVASKPSSPDTKDTVVMVSGEDPEMVAAMAKARETLPKFWKVFDKPEQGERNFAIKVKITDENGTEYFWMNEVERINGKILASINNDPNIVKSVKFGDRIEIPEADIADWLYMRGGKMVGNHTVKALFKEMPEDQVQEMKRMMADP